MASPDAGDPLEPLRRAFEALEAPEPADAYEDCDAPTRRALDALRACWGALEPPAPPALGARALRAPSRRRRRRIAGFAAAATLLALAGWRAFAPSPTAGPSEPAPPRAEGGAFLAGGAAARSGEAAPGPRSDLGAEDRASPASGGVAVARLAPDRIEMTSGNVRLVLLAGEPGDEDPSHQRRNPR